MAKSGKLTKTVSKSVQKAKRKGAVVLKAVPSVKKLHSKSVVAQPVAAKAAVKPSETGKKISARLIETIEKRKQAQEKQPAAKLNRFGKPAGRRGRRPKNVDYTPSHTEEEGPTQESDYEGIEYDTGIRVKSGAEDKGFGLDRFEDFDEELNFDW